MAAKKIKLTEFSSSNPSIWFLKAETIFANSEIISEKDKFTHLLQCLSIEQAEQFQSIIEGVNAADETHRVKDPYSRAKQLLLTCFGDSDEKRLRKLFAHQPIPDSNPREIYNYMKRNAGVSVSEKALRELFQSKIPPNVAPFLAASASIPLDQLVDLAENVYQIVNKNPVTAAVQAVQPLPTSPHKIIDRSETRRIEERLFNSRASCCCTH